MSRLAAALVAAVLLAGCTAGEPAATPSATPSATPMATATPTATPASPSEVPQTPAPTLAPRSVLAISVDGLNPDALETLGPAGAPAYWRLLDEGAATLDARTAVEQTVTLPNHTGMLTGRRIDAAAGGHGVTWNDERPEASVAAASVFTVVDEAGASAAMFAGKPKFATFGRSWPIEQVVLDPDADALTDALVADLTGERRRFTLFHLSLPDDAGHAEGFGSAAYVEAVAETDRLLGEVLAAVDATPRLSRRLVVVLTADHGGPDGARQHEDAGDPANFTVPFVIWGSRGIEAGDLYAQHPERADPGDAQPSYDGPQPVRNADLANVATDLLGLAPVPGSEFALDVTP